MELVLCEFGPDSFGLESISPFCLKAHRALKYHQLEYKRLHGMKPGEHKKYDPIGKVPVLLIDGEPVPDSTYILRALESISNKSLLPSDRTLRAEAWILEEYADQTLGPFVMAARWFDDRNWGIFSEEAFRDMPRVLRKILPNRIRKGFMKKNSHFECVSRGMENCWAEFQRHLEYLDELAPEKNYWLGEAITVADIGLFAMLHSLRTKMSEWQMHEISKHNKLSAWLDRVNRVTNF